MKILDLYEEYNEGLLDDFYNRFMIPNFGIFEGEIADIQAFKEYLDPKQRKFPADLIMHVILFIEDVFLILFIFFLRFTISKLIKSIIHRKWLLEELLVNIIQSVIVDCLLTLQLMKQKDDLGLERS